MTARSIRRAMERKAKKLEKKRLLANQANAQLSTGPQTPAGKATSSLNAVKTGLTGHTVLLPSDNTAEYDRHVAAFNDEYQPVGLQECELVQSIADTFWRLRRIPILETAIFAKGRIEFAELFNEQDLAARPHLIDAHTFLAYEKQIRNLQLQEARLARRREKEIAELRRLQNERTESRIQKKRQEIPANGFVFSTKPIEPAAIPQNRYHEPTALATASNSCLLTPVS